jgi:hypothetical protein
MYGAMAGLFALGGIGDTILYVQQNAGEDVYDKVEMVVSEHVCEKEPVANQIGTIGSEGGAVPFRTDARGRFAARVPTDGRVFLDLDDLGEGLWLAR